MENVYASASVKVKTEFGDEYINFYETTVYPELRSLSGCIFVGLIISSPQPDEFISLTF